MSGLVMGLVWELPLVGEFDRAEKYILLAYADHADQAGGSIFPSVDLISEKTGYKERAAILALADARAALETERARLLAYAYNTTGQIDGKNETVRKLQEAEYLENQNGLDWLARYEREAAEAVSRAEIERKTIEVEISLTKAWLYSLSGEKQL